MGKRPIAQAPDTVRAGYDAVAAEYARRFGDELAHKPLDRELLGRFAAEVAGGPVADLGCGPEVEYPSRRAYLVARKPRAG